MSFTTLEILAEQVIIQQNGGDQSSDSNLEEADVILLLKQNAANIAADYLGAKHYRREKDVDSGFVNLFIDQQVKKDTSRNLHYCELTELPLSLPNGKGVLNVYPGNEFANEFMPVMSSSIGLYGDAMIGEVTYAVEQGRIYFYGMDKRKIPKITYKLALTNLSGDDGTNSFYFPIELQSLLIAKVREILNTNLPEDNVNDSNDSNS